MCMYQTLKSRTAGKLPQPVECFAELVQFVCEIKHRIGAGALTLVRLLLRRLMSEVINRMLVMHTKMSINCNQNQPRKQIHVTGSRCTEVGANCTGGPRAGEILGRSESANQKAESPLSGILR